MSRKRVLSAAACFAAHITLTTLACAQPPAVNYLQLAVNKTYVANQVTSFPTGKRPGALAFDGEHIWVANQDDNTVTKFDTSTGAILGTFPTGVLPSALAFDGANVWVANQHDGTVMKLRASEGKILGTFPYASRSDGTVSLLFDGSNIWVLSTSANRLTKLRAADGANLGTFDSGGAAAMAFDGTDIWLAAGDLIKMRPSDGTHVQVVGLGATPESLTFDGTYIYVGLHQDGSILGVRASDGTIAKGLCAWQGCASQQPMPIMYPGSMVFDGAYIWATFVNAPGLQGLPAFVTKIRVSDGALMGTFSDVVGAPAAVAFDGTNIWITDASAYALVKL